MDGLTYKQSDGRNSHEIATYKETNASETTNSNAHCLASCRNILFVSFFLWISNHKRTESNLNIAVKPNGKNWNICAALNFYFFSLSSVTGCAIIIGTDILLLYEAILYQLSLISIQILYFIMQGINQKTIWQIIANFYQKLKGIYTRWSVFAKMASPKPRFTMYRGTSQ